MKNFYESTQNINNKKGIPSAVDSVHDIERKTLTGGGFGHPSAVTVEVAISNSYSGSSIFGSAKSQSLSESHSRVLHTDGLDHPKRINNSGDKQISNSVQTHAEHVSSSVQTHAAQDVRSTSSTQHQSETPITTGSRRLHVYKYSEEIHRPGDLQVSAVNSQKSTKKTREIMSIGIYPEKRKTIDELERVKGAKSMDSQDNHSECSSKKGFRKLSRNRKSGQSAGRWTPEEHQEFLEGLKISGREWKKVAERIPTRTSAQIRSHAQKYFAKLAREESMVLQDQLASIGSPRPSSVLSIVSEPTSDSSFSVQRNVERILANPNIVQHEVEDTLCELRERYRQLQVRLEDTNRSRDLSGTERASRRVIESYETSDYDSLRSPTAIEHRKRGLEESPVGSQLRYFHQDDLSSVSSSISGVSRTRELGNEELIALSVLGESLPRSSSSPDLPHVCNSSNMERSSSPTSTIASNQDGDDNSERSKRRKGADGRMIN
mmetsp:Transcript_18874/g.27918  ORF Transcript_18874/g.27918 Transcript_18874/m.27918 type:complete len:491 (+) Transcript_18874:423-1895(+)